jgi:hypothetical protein
MSLRISITLTIPQPHDLARGTRCHGMAGVVGPQARLFRLDGGSPQIRGRGAGERAMTSVCNDLGRLRQILTTQNLARLGLTLEGIFSVCNSYPVSLDLLYIFFKIF